MKNREQLKQRWEKQIPPLEESGKWWLEGDTDLLLITDNLAELLQTIEVNYGKSLKQVVYKAQLDEHGAVRPDGKYRYVVADYAQDAATGWHDDPEADER